MGNNELSKERIGYDDNIKQLLLELDKSIKEIASELHFPEQFTFRKFFKQDVGIPPTEYRHKMKRER